MDWPRYIRDFETHLRLERNLADNSVQAYLRDVSHLRRFAEPLGLEPADITADHLRQLLLQLNQTDIAVMTRNKAYHHKVHQTPADINGTIHDAVP